MKPSMVADSLWVLGTRLVMRGANLIVFLLLARSLSLSEFGGYGYIVGSVLMLSVAFDIGLRQSVAFHIGKQDSGSSTGSQLLLFWLVLTPLAALAMAMVMRFGGFGGDTAILLLACAAVVPALVIRMGQGVFLGEGRIKELNQSELLSRALLLFGTLGFWWAGALDLQAAAWLLCVSYAVAALYLVWQIRDLFAKTTKLDIAVTRSMLRHGMVFAGGIIAMIMLGRVGIWIVNALLPADDVGLYFGTLRLAEMVAEVATAVGVVIFSHGVRHQDAGAAAVNTVRVTRGVAALMAIVAVVAGLLATPILTLAMGADYAAAAGSFRILLVGSVASCFSMMLYPGLSSQGKARYGLLVFGPGTALTALMAYLLAPTFGILGAASALAIAQVCIAVGFVLVYRRLFDLPLVEILLPQREDFRAALRLLGSIGAKLQRA